MVGNSYRTETASNHAELGSSQGNLVTPKPTHSSEESAVADGYLRVHQEGGGGGGGSEVTVDGFAAGPCQTSTREIDWLTVFRANPRRKCTVSLLNPKENIAQRLDTLGIQRCHPIKDRQCNQNIFFQKSEVGDVRGFGVG